MSVASEPSTSSSVQLSEQCRHFTLFDILLATNNFDESLVIGRGGFGKVYRGTIFNGSATVVAAIKRLDPSSNQGAPEFWAEVEMLSKLRHCNLVSLFGYCNDGKEMILVYEYMPNGTLEDHLHKLATPLSWVQRLRICIGAGRGLHYLHTGTGIDVGVIHRDVKTSNILLQESWAAKISDFGLSKIGPTNQPSTCVNTLVKGTFGYFDPDYYATGKLTRKSDVYAFGVVLLEVLCRKRAVFDIDEEAFNLALWAQESIKEGNLKNIVDPDLRDQIPSKSLKEFVQITKGCLHSGPKQRSTMAEVLFCLESSVLKLQEKFNNSVQPAGRTILYRMINILPFPSNGENTVNQEPYGLITVNGESLSSDEVLQLQTCAYPPKRLVPGSYWYDKMSGLWGKEGHKPCQVTSPSLSVGGCITENASNGNTKVKINGRVISKAELLMLKFAGINCNGCPHFWVSHDGSYQKEGQDQIKGKIWEKPGIETICAFLSLPMPPKSFISSEEETVNNGSQIVSKKDDMNIRRVQR